MDDLDDKISSSGFEPLFIKEEEGEPERALMEQGECNTDLHGVTFTGTQLKQSSLIKPYLQEMDDLLKSCEELTGISFGSQYTEANLTESSHGQGKEEVTVEKYGETWKCPQAYLSTSYIDTHIDGTGTEEKPVQGQLQNMGTLFNRCGVTSERSHQTEMPLTSAGNKLSKTMVEYEGQLLGMLAMLESCMEEAGMDFEPQDWVTDESQEYVHINKNPQLYRGTTLVPIQQERPLKMEIQPMQLDSWEEGQVSKDNGNRMTAGSTTNRSQQKDLSGCVMMGGFSVERLERPGHLKTDKGFGFSGTPAEKDPVYCEGTKPGHVFEERMETMEDASETDVNVSELPSEERRELKTDTLDLGSGMKELGALQTQMEDCIEGVQQLQKRRIELLVEVLQLRGEKGQEEAKMASEEEETEEWIDSKVADLMDVLKKEEEGRREERKREIKSLREERAEEERRMWKVNLERQGLQDELRKLKRRLFAMARDCAHSQAALNNQRREVELLKREEEKLNSLMLQLTEEGYQLRLAQQQQLSDLIAKLQDQSSSQTPNTAEELTECRRHSCGDIQQYLQGGLRALEDRYEPILLALLKRREATAGALVKAKEQAQELRAQLRPLREEIEKLKLQRACLEEKLKLIHMQRRENVGQYKETVHFLEESSRELKTELKIQKRKTKEIKELRDSLAEQLLLCRDAIEDHNKGDDEEKT
ncbi:uncharacterized protein sync [Archocentrus centrarchus]|uniref:uncharacterized protein sync n=1 Tax=Archocentrus centrarchus TaxID=63155 RepID=UPI0011EA177E|nr:uncharacterized protein LOC115788527 [Archocentrus centrarchus]XP_030597446.1 uncharacterized protein LOC115788527 [Archocentrus centrarchus]